MSGEKEKPTFTQRAILENLIAGRRWDYGRAYTMAAAGGWDRSYMSCLRRRWIDRTSASVTDEGRAALQSQGASHER